MISRQVKISAEQDGPLSLAGNNRRNCHSKQPRGTQSDDLMHNRFASMSTCRLRSFDGILRIEWPIPVTHVVFQSSHRPLGGEMG